MRWEKKGRVYVADGSVERARHYAVPPTPHLRPDGILRLYVAFCDGAIMGRLGWVDVDAERPDRVVGVSRAPALDIGEPGSFDENGVLPTCVVEVDGELFLYYVGYQLGAKVKYYQFQGLAVSSDGGETFERRLRVPVIDRSDSELLNRTSAFLRRHGGGFEMWYVGGSEWTTVGSKPLPIYNLRYLMSDDGVHWPADGEVCLDFDDPDEDAFGRPWIVETGDEQLMFYSVRKRSIDYRIGYARSLDGRSWVRDDANVGIDVSGSGWGSEMIAYASVVQLDGRTVMFYNGNERGRTGFGYAELVDGW